MNEVDKAAARVISAMNDLLDRVASAQGYLDLDPAIMDGVTVPVGNGLAGAGAGRAATTALAARVCQVVHDAASSVDVWRADGVYCLQCSSPDCAHARPSSLVEVFEGYQATGKPSWVDFTNFCINRGVEGFETLFVPRPGVVAVSLGARELTGELLETFHDSGYMAVGAVLAGLIPVDFEPARVGQATFGVSLVAVARVQGGSLSIRLCQVGIDRNELDHAAGIQGHRGPAERLRRLLAATRGRLEAAALAVKHDAAARESAGTADAAALIQRLDAVVAPVMNRLRSDLVAVFSGVEDRTRHGEHRSRSGERPTSPAFADAAAATDERLFFDIVEKTVVVAGPRGRCHVFTRDARHITSLTLDPGELDQRLTRKRWRPLEPSATASFRQSLSRRRSSGGGE
ncbi:MAG TPA: hypothetical protein PKK50_06605 [Myxococcota bacterium]|nr:hypothetical protein [Myxococcota bacterium]